MSELGRRSKPEIIFETTTEKKDFLSEIIICLNGSGCSDCQNDIMTVHILKKSYENTLTLSEIAISEILFSEEDKRFVMLKIT